MNLDEIALTIADGDKIMAEKYSYIIRSKLHNWGTIAITLLASYFLGVLLYAIIISSSIMLIRINSGGSHSKNLNTCSVISFVIINGLSLLVPYIQISHIHLLIYSVFILIYGLYMITRYAPIDSPQRPIINPQFRKQLKIRSYIALLILISIFYIFHFYEFRGSDLSVLLGVSWVLFSMSKISYSIIRKIDSLLGAS